MELGRQGSSADAGGGVRRTAATLSLVTTGAVQAASSRRLGPRSLATEHGQAAHGGGGARVGTLLCPDDGDSGWGAAARRRADLGLRACWACGLI
jgi:hypothetical protein